MDEALRIQYLEICCCNLRSVSTSRNNSLTIKKKYVMVRILEEISWKRRLVIQPLAVQLCSLLQSILHCVYLLIFFFMVNNWFLILRVQDFYRHFVETTFGDLFMFPVDRNHIPALRNQQLDNT